MIVNFDELNSMPDGEFLEVLGDIFEHSPWVAERVAGERPFKSIRGLHQAMVRAVTQASAREQQDLINAHPDLAGKAALAGELTEASAGEQAGAGLDSLTRDEMARFHDLNDRYKSRFGFPFILAVKGHDKHSILSSFEKRLNHSQQDEKIEALRQISEIARFRLEALLVHDQQETTDV